MKKFTDYLEMIQEAKNNNEDLLKFKNLSEEIKHYEDQLSLSSANQSAIKKLIELYSKKNTVSNQTRIDQLQKQLKFGKKLENDFKKNYSVDSSIKGLTIELEKLEAQKKLEKNSANQKTLADSIKTIKIQIVSKYIKEQIKISKGAGKDVEKYQTHSAQAEGAQEILKALQQGANENKLKGIYGTLLETIKKDDDDELKNRASGMEESLELIGIKVE